MNRSRLISPELESRLKKTLKFQRSLSTEIIGLIGDDGVPSTNSVKLLRWIIDSIPAFIWIKDGKSNIIIANHSAAMVGSTTISKMENSHSSEWWPKDLVEKWQLDDQEVLRNGRPKRNIIEHIIIPSTGQKCWLKTDKVPMLDDSGVPKLVLVCSTDITDLIPQALIDGNAA